MGIFSFTDFLGNLDRLNASRFALHIRRKARGYLSLYRDLLILLKSETLSLPQSFLYPLVYTLNCDTSEIRAGMKGPYPSQKCHVLLKLKMAQSRQDRKSVV